MINFAHYHCEEIGCHNKVGQKVYEDAQRKGKKVLCYKHNLKFKDIMNKYRYI